MAKQQEYNSQSNLDARNAVLMNAIEMKQGVYAQAVPAPIVGNIINIPLRNVGLNKRIVVEITGTIAQTGVEVQSLTKWGLANLVSNVTLTDLSNYQRVNTTGWHLHTVASLRRQNGYGSAKLIDSPVTIGSNVPVMTSPAQITAAKPIRMFLEIPLAYSDFDLRGAIFAAAVNATWNLQITINPGMFAAAGSDATLAAYQSSSAVLGTASNFNIKVYQIYLDQLPYSGGNPVLPLYDLATAYLLNNTAQTAIVANQDYPIGFANYRQFLSVAAIFDNGGQLNPGSDLNYVGIQAANLVFLTQTDPFFNCLETRDLIGDDFPPGTYIFNTRARPINTAQTGNTQLVFNASLVNANASILTGWESIALINQAINAGSLAGN